MGSLEFKKFFSHNQGLILGHPTVIKNALGTTVGMHVKYVNQFAVHTFMGTDSVGRDV